MQYQVTGFIRQWVNYTVEADSEDEALEHLQANLDNNFETDDIEVTEIPEGEEDY